MPDDEPYRNAVPNGVVEAPPSPSRAQDWLDWAQQTFGDVALEPRERTLRFVEEAIELAQAMGLDAAILAAVVERVFAKPAGDRVREFGQCLAVFECLALAVGVDAEAEATAELARVKSVPQAEWDRRHAAKVNLGIANTAKAPPSPDEEREAHRPGSTAWRLRNMTAERDALQRHLDAARLALSGAQAQVAKLDQR